MAPRVTTENLPCHSPVIKQSAYERKQTINHCSSFQALGSPDLSPGSWLSITQKTPPARSPSLIYCNKGKPQRFILRNSLLHANKGPLVKRIGSGFDTTFKEREKERERKKWKKKKFLNEVVKFTRFPKTHSSLLFRAGGKRTRMSLIEPMESETFIMFTYTD